MSYRAPGGSVVTPSPSPAAPPTASRRRSLWLIVAIAIGVVAVLLLGLVGFAAYAIGKGIHKPFTEADKAALAKDFQDVPIYPQAILDEQMTQAQRSIGAVSEGFGRDLDADKVVIGAYLSSESPDEVQHWYDGIMPGIGYHAMQYPMPGDVRPLFYRRGKTAILVVVTPLKSESGSSIVILKAVGTRDDYGDVEGGKVLNSGPIPIGQGAVGMKATPPPATKGKPGVSLSVKAIPAKPAPSPSPSGK